MTTAPTPDAHPTHRNVRAIVDLERLGQQRKSFGDAIGERIARATGRLSFLALNVGVLAAWALWNLYAPSIAGSIPIRSACSPLSSRSRAC